MASSSEVSRSSSIFSLVTTTFVAVYYCIVCISCVVFINIDGYVSVSVRIRVNMKMQIKI